MNSKTRNVRYLVGETAFMGVLSGIIGTFLSIFALRMGATSQDIGLLSALPALVTMLWLLPSAHILEHYQDILRPVLIWGLLERLPYALLAFVVILPFALRVPGLLAVVGLCALTTATGSVAFTVMFGMLVPQSDRARVVSTRSLLTGVTSAIGAIGGGKLLEIIPFPANYAFLFLVGFVFSMVSLALTSKLRCPPVSGANTGTPLDIRQMFVTVAKAKPFVRFTLATFVANWGLSMPGPLYAIYWVRVLNMGEWWIGIIQTVASLVPLFTYPLWARVAERFGNRRVMAIGVIGVALFPITTVLAPSQEFLLIPAVLGGIFSPPWNLGFYNGLFDVIPSTQQPTFISMNTISTNLAAFLAPLLSTVILAPLIGIGPALLAAAAVRVLGGIVLYVFLKDEDRIEHG